MSTHEGETRCNKKQRTNEYSAEDINKAQPLKDVTPSVIVYRTVMKPKKFYCACRSCRQFFYKGQPIECFDPVIVAPKHPKWTYLGPAAKNKLAARRDANAGTVSGDGVKDKSFNI